MAHAQESVDVWSVEGLFSQIIYSPRGEVEGVLLDTDGIATQFVTDPHDSATAQALAALRPGQALVVEGTLREPSDKGEPEHTVYDFERLVSVDGKAARPAAAQHQVMGKVVRFNYAKHGAANGVVLDSGDFVHTRPDGLARLKLKLGDAVSAEGPLRRLATGEGRVVEAQRVNGKPVH